jgi:hypothetical protein
MFDNFIRRALKKIMTILRKPGRAIPIKIQKQLLRDSGGQCAICVAPDPKSTTVNAHIIPYGDEGPRADRSYNQYIHNITNLILLCPNHHEEIDRLPVKQYTAEMLREIKRAHEERIANSRRHHRLHDPVPALRAFVVMGELGSWRDFTDELPDYFDIRMLRVQKGLRSFEKSHYLSLPFEDPNLARCYDDLIESFHNLAEVESETTERGVTWYDQFLINNHLLKLRKDLGSAEQPFDLNSQNTVRDEIRLRAKNLIHALSEFTALVKGRYRNALV